MKVIHLLSSNQFSGAENVACQIMEMFREEVDINMVYVSPDGPIRNALNERNVNYISIKKMSVREIYNMIHRENPDIIHAHDMRASTIAALVCGKTKLISHVHNNSFKSRKISVKSLLYLIAVRKAMHIFWVSDSAFLGYRFNRLCKTKSSVLYNVIDVDALNKKKEEDQSQYNFDIVYVGRLSYEKNPQRLLKIISSVVHKMPNLKVAVVGIGDLEAEIKRLIKQYNLEDNVNLMGFQSNPLKIMHDSKVMLMTSRWEGTPMCALEAMALGLPIVSTPTDGLKTLVEHGVNGYLSDNDSELENYVIRLICDDILRSEMSITAHKKAIHINDKDTYKKTIKNALHE